MPSYSQTAHKYHEYLSSAKADSYSTMMLEIPGSEVTLKDMWENPHVHIFSLLLRGTSRRHNRLAEALKDNVPKMSENTPYATAHPLRADRVYVYPNVKLPARSMVSTNELKSVTFATKVWVFENLLSTITKDMQHDKRKVIWEDAKKSKKFLFKRDTMTISKFLTRYGKFDSNVIDSDIRDMAQNIENDMKPVALVFAETPSDFLDMYGSGPTSCMTDRDGDKWSFMAEHGQHPASFYSYYPYTKGAYIKRKGEVAARTLLYRDTPTGKYTKYGRIYSENPSIEKAFIQVLADNGVTEAIDKFVPTEDVGEFEVEGIFSDSMQDYVFPNPYVDNIGYRMDATFDVKKRKFIVYSDKANEPKTIQVACSNQGGFVLAKQVILKRTCSLCGGSCGSHTLRHGTFLFCGTGCMVDAGFAHAYRSDRQREVRPINDCVQDYAYYRYSDTRSGREHMYTTLHAFKTLNPDWVYYLGCLTDTPNESKVSSKTGSVFWYQGELCAVGPAWINAIECGRLKLIAGGDGYSEIVDGEIQSDVEGVDW
jgi:hypothetical protein